MKIVDGSASSHRSEARGGSSMLVRALRTAEEFDRYIDFGRSVYRGHPQWWSPIRTTWHPCWAV